MPNELIFSPGADLITDQVVVVMQDRPVIGMSSWLSDTMASAAASSRDVQLVTPVASRLTWPVRSLLFQGTYSRWVVSAADGEYFDGLNGSKLRWNGDQFVTALTGDAGQEQPEIDTTFVSEDEVVAHLQLTVRVRHQATESLELGQVVEKLFAGTSGGGPSGWSTSEPVTQPWSRAAVTEFCRGRAPRPSWLVVSGPAGDGVKPVVGTIEIRRTQSGVDETVTLSVAQPARDFPSTSEVGTLIDSVADDFTLISAMAIGAYGAADGTYTPRFVGVPAPIGVAAGHEAWRGRDLSDVLTIEGVPKALAIGPAQASALWYPLGDGHQPDDWEKYRMVMDKLVPSEASNPQHVANRGTEQ
ncbi:DUF6177 family protein [Kribbella sp. NPDC051952]|uniref:DUF6177 family protein n=1 Tax=Kribbella sp. NPDC051952 TaxID=3154851 RepID=UPI00342106B4